jgi:hypothetical protein
MPSEASHIVLTNPAGGPCRGSVLEEAHQFRGVEWKSVDDLSHITREMKDIQ